MRVLLPWGVPAGEGVPRSKGPPRRRSFLSSCCCKRDKGANQPEEPAEIRNGPSPARGAAPGGAEPLRGGTAAQTTRGEPGGQLGGSSGSAHLNSRTVTRPPRTPPVLL